MVFWPVMKDWQFLLLQSVKFDFQSSFVNVWMNYSHKDRGNDNLAVVAENFHSLKSFSNVWQARKPSQITQQIKILH
jgi:hypothetical protein